MSYDDGQYIKTFTIDMILTFGKYKGKAIGQVLGFDQSYLIWMHETVWNACLEDELYEALVYSQEQRNNPGRCTEENPEGIRYLSQLKYGKEWYDEGDAEFWEHNALDMPQSPCSHYEFQCNLNADRS